MGRDRGVVENERAPQPRAAQNESPTNQPKDGSFAKLIAFLAAVVAPAAYLLGYNYYNGYIDGFGLPVERFPLSTPIAYVFSYQAVGIIFLTIADAAAKVYNALTSPPMIYLVVAVLAAAIGFLYLTLKIRQSRRVPLLGGWMGRALSWLHWDSNAFVKSSMVIGVLAYLVIALLLFVMSVAVAWWGIPVAAYEIGRKEANKRIAIYKEDGCHADKKTAWDNCVIVVDKDGKPKYEGLLIVATDSELAILEKTKTKTINRIIKREDGYELQRELHQVLSATADSTRPPSATQQAVNCEGVPQKKD